ncbi:unnamed protein product [marine sediment metagenome]|uniref:Uncharacterized protein n=1 Tax=marine sediment metagenome TaxID=412755 RepID=X1BYB1_9ZZZZ
MKIVVNITSYVGTGGNAEHYYAKVWELDTKDSIYVVAQRALMGHGEELERTFTDVKETRRLNQKDDTRQWKIGGLTERFGSIKQIKNFVSDKYPDSDLAFLWFNNMESEDRDIVERNPAIPEKTGEKIKIQNFEGFSSEFVNLTEGSIHEVLGVPARYQGKETPGFEGVWVWGVTEPVKILTHEYIKV